MTLEERIKSFSQLGKHLNDFSKDYLAQNTSPTATYYNEIESVIVSASHHNGWFTPENVFHAIQSWADLLTPEKLTSWLQAYDIPSKPSKNVLVIMAGNIPLVGFHDFLSVLLAGHRVTAKLSSNDKVLLPLIGKLLMDINPKFKDFITFSKERTNDFDAVIATGSDNTARYFEYYFAKKPHIIRKNRNSVAVLNGKESQETLEKLGEDIFRYYGLGCRSVSKLYVPKDYNFDNFFNAMYGYNEIIKLEKYANNYDYNKAVYLMSEFKLLDNGFMMLKEEKQFGSPIATVFYEYYNDLEDLKAQLNLQKDAIQCIVGSLENQKTIKFGQTQQPQLSDYADGVDTVDFLLKI